MVLLTLYLIKKIQMCNGAPNSENERRMESEKCRFYPEVVTSPDHHQGDFKII